MNPLLVSIRGIGETGPTPEDPRSIPEMVLEAVEAALTDAGLDLNDMDAAVTASADLLDGLTASNIAITEVVGAVMKPETRIAGDGLCAAIQACMQIAAGAYERVLVVAHGKASMAPQDQLSAWSLDPVFLQPLGVDAAVVAGLAASALDLPLTPLGPPADGASAVVLQRGVARDGLAIRGFGLDLAPPAPRGRAPEDWSGLARAARRALDMAGRPSKHRAFAVIEDSCRYAHERELFARALGLDHHEVTPCASASMGDVPIAAGLGRLCAAARRLRMIAGPARALVHGAWGACGQGQAVMLVERAA